MSRFILTTVAVFAFNLVAPALFGADNPAAVRRGDQYQLATAKTQNIHANDHARLLAKYAAASHEPVPSDVVQHHMEAIRANTDLASKSYGKLSAATKQDPLVSKQLAEINKRLATVNDLVAQLEAKTKQEAVESKAVIAKTNALSQEFKATHVSSKAIDQAFIQAAQSDDQFSDRDSSDYYFTGEGHFID